MLPIPDPNCLLEWANNVAYEKLTRFIAASGADGHSSDTINRLVRIAEQRRWTEEERVRLVLASDRSRPIRLSIPDRLWQASQRRETLKRSLADLRELDPAKFEGYVAELFAIQGYDAKAVGGPSDTGVDVEVREKGGKLWGVVQCKRYAQHCRVSTSQVLSFGGAFMISKATVGFIVTTGELTRQALRTAKSFDWLTVYSGTQLVEFDEQVRSRKAEISPQPGNAAGT